MNGKKTYATAAIAIITAGLSWWSGDMTQAEAVQLALGAVMAATIRHGVK